MNFFGNNNTIETDVIAKSLVIASVLVFSTMCVGWGIFLICAANRNLNQTDQDEYASLP